MKLESQRILITGAGGGIGQELCAQLAARKARLWLLDRNPEIVERMVRTSGDFPAGRITAQADITRAEERDQAINKMVQSWGGIDILINLAGVLDFARFDEQDPGMIQRILQVNVEAPMQPVVCCRR